MQFISCIMVLSEFMWYAAFDNDKLYIVSNWEIVQNCVKFVQTCVAFQIKHNESMSFQKVLNFGEKGWK